MSAENLLDLYRWDSGLALDLLAYQRFLDQVSTAQRAEEPYLFFESRVRFSLEPDDSLLALDALELESTKTGCVIHHFPTALSIPLLNVDANLASRILDSIQPGRSVFGVQLASGCTPQQLDVVLRETFGKVIFAPQALAHLESRISGSEIVRFVGSPYEIQRPYWSNMADARERLLANLMQISDAQSWVGELRVLHIILLLGANRRSYYLPQSPLGRRDARPGAFYETPTRKIREAELTLLVDGPRVSAPWVGGRRYHELLSQSVGDESAMLRHRQLRDSEGLDWGEVCWGLARYDASPAAWFCPPRPITSAHWDSLLNRFTASRRAAEHRESSVLTDALAQWHWRWVRLHPFRCANQSLGMNVVNALASVAGIPGIPHLLLDQLALRFSEAAYRSLFARAMRHWAVDADSSSQRWQRLADYRRRLDQFVGEVGAIGDAEGARAFIAADPLGARLALLSDESSAPAVAGCHETRRGGDPIVCGSPLPYSNRN